MTQEQKPKITLIIKDSEHADTGLVLDSLGTVPLEVTKDYDVVGTWQRLRCGIVVELTTTIQARQDILINLLKELPPQKYSSDSPMIPLHMRESKICDYQYQENASISRFRVSQSKSSKPDSSKPDSSKQDSSKPVSDEFSQKYDELRRRLSGGQ